MTVEPPVTEMAPAVDVVLLVTLVDDNELVTFTAPVGAFVAEPTVTVPPAAAEATDCAVVTVALVPPSTEMVLAACAE